MRRDEGREAYIEEVTASALRRHRWFIRQPLLVRLAVAFGVAAAMTAFVLAAAYGLERFGDEPFDKAAFWVPVTALAVAFFGSAAFVARDPARFFRAGARHQAGYPTRAPGYGRWHGDDGRKISRGRD